MIKKKLLGILAASAMTLSLFSFTLPCNAQTPQSSKIIVVSANGDYAGVANPIATCKTISEALSKATEGTTILVKAGTYEGGIDLRSSSKKQYKGITIKAYENDQVILTGKNLPNDSNNDAGAKEDPVFDDSGDYVSFIKIRNSSDIVLDHLILQDYAASKNVVPVGIRVTGICSNITIQNCEITNITLPNQDDVNGHGILVRGTTNQAITNVNILHNEIHDLNCGNSEVLVLNANVDGFNISNNYIHDNDNIGIDLIGYENPYDDLTSSIKKSSYYLNQNSELNRARNGVCSYNTIYKISTEKNPTYTDMCSAGIYVDGGCNIKIHDNVVEETDIGIEISSEHKGKNTDNIEVNNNLIYKCIGFAGIGIGGEDSEHGSATNTEVHHNTIYNEPTKDDACNIAIQYINNTTNKVYKNVCIGGKYNKHTVYNLSEDGNESKVSFKNNIFNNLDTGTKVDSSNKVITLSGMTYDRATHKITYKTNENLTGYGYSYVAQGNDVVTTPATSEETSTEKITSEEKSTEKTTSEKKTTEKITSEAKSTEKATSEEKSTEKITSEEKQPEKETTEEAQTPSDNSCSYVIDGKDSDWSMKALASSGNIKSVKADSDNNAVYFCINVSKFNTNYQLFIDADSNTATGYSSEGYDYMIENGKLYRSKGSGWNWEKVDQSAMKLAKSSTILELRLDINQLSFGDSYKFKFIILNSKYEKKYQASGVGI